mgnify:CR=1 FL=1
MVKAVMLVGVKPQIRIAEKAKAVEGVKGAFDVAGRFDAVSVINVEELKGIKKVAFKVQEIEGAGRREALCGVGEKSESSLIPPLNLNW